MKINKGWYVLIVTLVVLFLVKWKFFPSEHSAVKQKPPKGPISVDVFVANARDFNESLKLTGSVISAETVDLMPEVSGKLIAVYVAEGSSVKKGQLLAKLNDSELQAQRLRIEALLKNAKLEAERNKNLWEGRAIPREEYDLSLLQVETQEAELAVNAAQIAKTELRAPFDGTIGNRYVSPGAMVSTSTVFAKVYQNSKLKVQVDIPSSFRSRLKVNNLVTVSNAEGATTRARIYSIEPGADPTSRTFMLRAEMSSSGNDFLPGDFVTVAIGLDKIPNAITIPTQSLIPVLKGQKVYVVKNGESTPRDIMIGNRNDSSVLVLSGLESGDSVITRGVMFVKPGSKLKIVKASGN